MRRALVTALVLLGGACIAAPPAAEIVTRVPQDTRPVEIVSTAWNQERTGAVVSLRSALGIFAIHLDLAETKLKKLSLLVQKEKFCEGLEFQPAGDKSVSLRGAEGVSIRPQGDDLLIEIAPPTLELLRRPGTLQFINQYR